MATVFWFMTLFLHGLVFAHLVPDTITILNDRDFTEFTNFIPESDLTLTYSLDEPRKWLSSSNVQHGRVEIALSTVVPGVIRLANIGTKGVHYCLKNLATNKWTPKKTLPVGDVRRINLQSVTILINSEQD